MPLFSTTLTGVANNAPVAISLPVDRGHLISASLARTDLPGGLAAVMGTITLDSVETIDRRTVATLARGELTVNGPIGWVGSIPLSNNLAVTGTIQGDPLTTCVLSIYYEKV
jgi:hypothetical protein